MTAKSQAPPGFDKQFNVSRESLERLATYVRLLLRWQERINLIGPSTAEQIWTRHVSDSLQLLSLIPSHINDTVDLGSGAGFPGLVLAIASTQRVTLVESNEKKAAFLREAIRMTAATASVAHQRIESLKPMSGPKLITSRALAPLPKLLDFSSLLFQNDTVALFHKGRDVEKEVEQALKTWTFTVQRHRSMTDPDGVILEIANVKRLSS